MRFHFFVQSLFVPKHYKHSVIVEFSNVLTEAMRHLFIHFSDLICTCVSFDVKPCDMCN